MPVCRPLLAEGNHWASIELAGTNIAADPMPIRILTRTLRPTLGRKTPKSTAPIARRTDPREIVALAPSHLSLT